MFQTPIQTKRKAVNMKQLETTVSGDLNGNNRLQHKRMTITETKNESLRRRENDDETL